MSEGDEHQVFEAETSDGYRRLIVREQPEGESDHVVHQVQKAGEWWDIEKVLDNAGRWFSGGLSWRAVEEDVEVDCDEVHSDWYYSYKADYCPTCGVDLGVLFDD